MRKQLKSIQPNPDPTIRPPSCPAPGLPSAQTLKLRMTDLKSALAMVSNSVFMLGEEIFSGDSLSQEPASGQPAGMIGVAGAVGGLLPPGPIVAGSDRTAAGGPVLQTEPHRSTITVARQSGVLVRRGRSCLPRETVHKLPASAARSIPNNYSCAETATRDVMHPMLPLPQRE